MRSIILVLIVTFFVTGCSEKKIYVDRPIIKYEKLPNVLLVDDVNVTRPPNREVFVKAGPLEREALLTTTIIDLYSSIKKYKNKIEYIKEYNDAVSELNKEIKE